MKELVKMLDRGSRTYVSATMSADTLRRKLTNAGLNDGVDFTLVEHDGVVEATFNDPFAAVERLTVKAPPKPEVVNAVLNFVEWTKRVHPDSKSKLFLPSLAQLELAVWTTNHQQFERLSERPLLRPSDHEFDEFPEHGMFFRALAKDELVPHPYNMMAGIPEHDESCVVSEGYGDEPDQGNWATDYLSRDPDECTATLTHEGTSAAMLVAFAPFADGDETDAKKPLRSPAAFLDYVARLLRAAFPSPMIDVRFYPAIVKSGQQTWGASHIEAMKQFRKSHGVDFDKMSALRLVVLLQPAGTPAPGHASYWLNADDCLVPPADETENVPTPVDKVEPEDMLRAQALWAHLVCGSSPLKKSCRRKPVRKLLDELVAYDWDERLDPNSNVDLQRTERSDRSIAAAVASDVAKALVDHSASTRTHVVRVVPMFDGRASVWAKNPLAPWRKTMAPAELTMRIETDVPFDHLYKSHRQDLYEDVRKIALTYIVLEDRKANYPAYRNDKVWDAIPELWFDLFTGAERELPTRRLFRNGYGQSLDVRIVPCKCGTAVDIALCGNAAATVLFNEALRLGWPDDGFAERLFTPDSRNVTPPNTTTVEALRKLTAHDAVKGVPPFNYNTRPSTPGARACVLMRHLVEDASRLLV